MVLEYAEGRFIRMTAGADITAGQLVEITGDEEVSPATAGSTSVIGVALTDASQNELVTVVTEGVVSVTASGAVSAGDKVQAAADGKVSAWSASAAGDSAKIVGVALEDAADGNTVKIKLEV
jgi:predicted RecA/RadA family phage recombinase